jgi:hypothetical protein
MSDHGQRFAMINGKGRHVVVLKLFMLIIAENDHNIRIDFLQGISQRLNGFLARFIALAELFGREFSLEIGFRPLQQALIVQPRIMFILFPQHGPVTRAHAQLRTMRCPDT